MTNFITIRNVKKITEEIKIVDFDKVNYLVGPNGCGKSSVLSALKYFSRNIYNEAESTEPFLKEGSIITYNDGVNENVITAKNNIVGGNKLISVQELNHWQRSKEDDSSIQPQTFKIINETSDFIGMPAFEVKRVFKDNDPWSTNEARRIFTHSDFEIDIPHLSSGLLSFYQLKQFFQIFEIAESNMPESADTIEFNSILFLLEEPEINLHPDLQKKIPELINEYLNRLSDSLRAKTFIFVSTHSPFIISNTRKYDGQKVYPMSEGAFVNLEGLRVNSSSGFHGGEVVRLVASMLGSEITDLGYPETFCLVEESSLQQILKKLRDNNLIKNIEFISTSGAPKLAKLNDTVNEIQNLNLLLKCNPLYVDNYLVILDNFQDLANKKDTKNSFERLSVIKEKLGDRFTELSKYSLEDFYVNISPEIHSQAVEEIATAVKEKKSSKEIGDIKHKYALRIADLIVDQELFSMLFEGELDFLFR